MHWYVPVRCVHSAGAMLYIAAWSLRQNLGTFRTCLRGIGRDLCFSKRL